MGTWNMNSWCWAVREINLNSCCRRYSIHIVTEMFDYLRFYVPLKNFSLIWRRHHYRWRAAKFRPMLSAQEGIFIVPHPLRHGASVFPVSSEGPPQSVASYDKHGDVEDLFLPGSSRVPYQSPFTTHKGIWRTYSNLDPHGSSPMWNESYAQISGLGFTKQ
jgi:hypothetical protein